MKNTTWWKNAVVYEIYPRSFLDTNGDGIGDIQGIISKLDYLKDLGVDVIWLCPLYKSPNKDNGYDISDYQEINPEYGTMADFDELLETAHQKGLKIIMDLVVNHTSSEHQWFIEAKKSKDNPYRDYYIWRENTGSLPNQLPSVFGGSCWELDKESNMYYFHLYAKEQPDLNWENENVRKEIYAMMKWWLDKGIDGFRMDVINQLSKDFGRMDLFGTEGNSLWKIITQGPKRHEYIKEMNREVLSQYDMMTVGETSAVTIEDGILYGNLDQTELNMIFQFDHMGLDRGKNLTYQRPELLALRTILSKWQTELHGKAWNSLFWNNHDRPRVVSKYGDDSTPFYREKSAKMLAVLLYLMEGTPYIYQGEEIGMTNPYYPSIELYDDIETINLYKQYKDIYSTEHLIQYFGKRSRDNARTPIPWNDTMHGGFTSGIPWLTMGNNIHEINVEKALANKDSVYYFYQALFKLRKQYEVLIDGAYEVLLEDDPNIFAYRRYDKQDEIIVICNYHKDDIDISLIPDGYQLLISNYKDDLGKTLRAYEAKVYYKTKG